MNARSVRLLELDKVLLRLEEKTASALGLAKVRGLQPIADIELVRSRLAETSEARRFAETVRIPPFGGISDVRAPVQRAAVGSLLDPTALLAVAQFAAGARRLREALQIPGGPTFPLLHSEAAGIVPHPALEQAVFQAIEEDTRELKDDASLDLLRARRNIRQTQHNIQARLRGMLSDPNVQPHLQDAFVTIRDGRYCLPVRAESRSRVPGIVHDRSGSGGAFFVEPQAVVELNNHLRELQADERDAIAAILADLSARVATVASDLQTAIEASANLDFAFSKAALSREMNGLEPPVDSPAAPSYKLLQARHPLVPDCVANDIVLGEAEAGSSVTSGEGGPAGSGDSGFDVMLITGPNTGGKTVVLKTLGLLALMASCGLHLPVAPGSRLSIPGQVFADIGDEQSIEQSLSTFSSHVRTIVQILREATAGDLVLLDEVGAGTDPDEGAALAKAVLRALQRRGVQVVATTHYGELKQFALGSQRFRNASVEFDIATLKPTYHLRIGVPGASNALDIAARLGMPAELVGRARRYLGRERAEAEVATQNLEQTQRELTLQTETAVRERNEIEKLRRDYETQIARVQREAESKITAAQSEAHNLVRETQIEAERILRDLRSADRESKQTEVARGRLRTLAERSAASAGSNPPQARPEPESRSKTATEQASSPEPMGAAGSGARQTISGRARAGSAQPRGAHDRSEPTPRVGDIVRVSTIDKEGVLLSEPDAAGRVAVRVGAARVKVDFEAVRVLPRGATAPSGVSGIRTRKSFTIADEINVIGETTDQAIPTIDKYLDDALLADSAQVRIVHGRGTGALRTAIHRLLKTHRGVVEYGLAPPNEGGEGATVVLLRSGGE